VGAIANSKMSMAVPSAKVSRLSPDTLSKGTCILKSSEAVENISQENCLSANSNRARTSPQNVEIFLQEPILRRRTGTLQHFIELLRSAKSDGLPGTLGKRVAIAPDSYCEDAGRKEEPLEGLAGETGD
jgi:hypothetical protein